MRHMVFAAIMLVSASFSGAAFAETLLPPRPVLWTTAALQTPKKTELVGVIEPKIKTDLGFQILGRLIVKNVTVGEVISRGQLLAAVDPTPFELAVRTAQSGVSDARAQLATALAEEARQQTLFTSNATPETALEMAVQQLDTAKANETRALAVLAKAEEQLGYTRIFAEHDGIVIAVYPEVGEIVAPGQVVLTVARLDIREAVVDIPDVLATGLAVGDQATISLELAPQAQVMGDIREIEPAADSVSRTVRARITLRDVPESFRLGSTVFVRFDAKAPPAIILPLTAIRMQDGIANVWIINEDGTSARLAQVSIATPKGDFVEISSGVAPGDRVVAVGVNSLTTATVFRLGEELTY